MNFYKKYLKYKNKYLILKGGEFQLSPTFIDKIDSIIKLIKNINYIRSSSISDFDSKNVKNRLIFNILLYGGFIFRKETIIDGDTGQSRQLIDNNGIFFNNEPRITCILKENYIFNSSNPTEISCEVKNIIDLLKKYSIYYYDNYPEIFNYNNNVLPYKSIKEFNLNDLFCLLFMIIKDNSEDSVAYFALLKRIKSITILNSVYIKFDLNIRFKIFFLYFNNNYLINQFPINNERIFNTTPDIDVNELKNIDFNKSTTYNKYFLFNIPNLIDASNENFFENAEDPRLEDNKTLYLEYNQDDVNDFNLSINFCGNIIKINNLIKNMPDIFYIVKCCISSSQIIDYYYNQVYVNPNVVSRTIIKYRAINFVDRQYKLRDGINKNTNYDEINLLSSYWDHPPGRHSKCRKDTPERTLPCIFSPLLTDHSGFLVKFRNRMNVIKFLSLNIAEYQEFNRINASMLNDNTAHVYFNRIKNILYLLIKVLKKEDIEFCFVQELFKAQYDKVEDLTCERRNIIFIFIKNYLNLYDYDIKDVPFNNYNNIIYKKNYDFPSNNFISEEKFTSILIDNTSICSVKFRSREVNKHYRVKFYLICIFATIFNTYPNCNEIIMSGDFNFKLSDTQLDILNDDDIIYGPSVDHAIVIRRRLMMNYINKLRFDIIFPSIIIFVRENLRTSNIAAGLRADALSQILQQNLFGFTEVRFQRLNNISNLLNVQRDQSLNDILRNKYNYIKAIFYLSYYFLNIGRTIDFSKKFVFDLRPFHDFSMPNNLNCIYGGDDDGRNHGYLWNLMQFLHLNL